MTESPQPEFRQQKLKKKYWLILTLNLSAGAIIFAFFPDSHPYFIQEGMFVENISAWLFLLSFILGCIAILNPNSRREMPYFAYIIPFLGLAAFADETSFLGYLQGTDKECVATGGEKITILGYQVDGIHDLFTLIFKLWRDNLTLAGDLISIIIIGTIISQLIIKRHYYMPKIMELGKNYPAFDYLRYTIIIIVIAQILDLDLNIFSNNIDTFLEEILEANGGMSLTFASISLFLGKRKID